MKFLVAGLLVLLCAPLSVADAAGLDVESMTREQLNKLDVFVLMRHFTKDVPAANRFNVDAFTSSLIKKHMAMLLYPVDMSVFNAPDKDPKFKDQIKELQKRMGVPQTGVLLQEQFDALTKAAETVSEHGVYPPPGMFIYGSPPGTSGYVTAKGTWVMEGDAFPVNYNEITCIQSTQTCTEITVNIVQPNQVNDDRDFNILLWTTDFRIISWDDKEVSAIRETQCRRERLTINTSSKQAFHITTDKSAENCTLPTGEKLPLLGKPQISTLGDGFKEPKKFYDERKKQAQRLLYEPATKSMGAF